MLVKPLKLAVMKNEVALLEKYEKEIGQICEKTVFVAEKEAYEFNQELKQDKAVAVPIGVDVDYFYYREPKATKNIVGFLGAMSVAHNENAVRHFIFRNPTNCFAKGSGYSVHGYWWWCIGGIA